MVFNRTTINTCCHKNKINLHKSLINQNCFKQGKWLLYFDPYQFDWHQWMQKAACECKSSLFNIFLSYLSTSCFIFCAYIFKHTLQKRKSNSHGTRCNINYVSDKGFFVSSYETQAVKNETKVKSTFVLEVNQVQGYK